MGSHACAGSGQSASAVHGVEGLDTDLIDPDNKFEFAIPEFEPYKLTEHDIEVVAAQIETLAEGSAILTRADEALYRSKRLGRNQVNSQPPEPDHAETKELVEAGDSC